MRISSSDWRAVKALALIGLIPAGGIGSYIIADLVLEFVTRWRGNPLLSSTVRDVVTAVCGVCGTIGAGYVYLQILRRKRELLESELEDLENRNRGL